MGFSKYLLPPKLYSQKCINSSLRHQKRVTDKWSSVVDAYFNGETEKFSIYPKKNLENEKIIWQYWGQGIDNNTMPEIVQICFNSVDKYKGEYKVIRLSDATISDYVDIPEFVWEKRKNNPEFTITFFSDLLRLILINAYGGIWMDATILLTDNFPQKYIDCDYFFFSRSDDELYKEFWVNYDAYYFCWRDDFKVRFLSSIIFAKKGSELIHNLLNVMLLFWKNSEKLPCYFTLHVIYEDIIRRKMPEAKCMVVSDCLPHIIQTKLKKGNPHYSFKDAVNLNNIHKMTYYKENELAKLKEVLKELSEL